MQNKMFKALPFAAALAILAAGNTASAQDVVVKIGHVGPLTGAIAHLGKDNENGARLAVEEINKAGLTIDGKKVKLELVAEDDAGDPKPVPLLPRNWLTRKLPQWSVT